MRRFRGVLDSIVPYGLQMDNHEDRRTEQLGRTGEAGGYGDQPHTNDCLLRPMAGIAVQTKSDRSQGSIRMSL